MIGGVRVIRNHERKPHQAVLSLESLVFRDFIGRTPRRGTCGKYRWAWFSCECGARIIIREDKLESFAADLMRQAEGK